MTTKRLIEKLRSAFRNQIKVLLVGMPAVAKTACLKLAGDLEGFRVLVLHPALWDPTDGKGMPCSFEEEGRTVCKFLPFQHLLELINATVKTLVVIDDIGQAPFTVQATIMPMIWDRMLCGEAISDHVLFAGATNRREDGAGVVGILEPLKTRFDCVLEVEPSSEDLVSYFVETGKDVRICAYLRTHPQEVHVMPKGTALRGMEPWPNFRTWESVDKWLKVGETDIDIIAGCVGKASAAQFHAFLELTEKAPDPRQILSDPDSVPVPEEMGIRHAACLSLLKLVKVTNLGNAMKWIAGIGQQFEIWFMIDLVTSQPKFANTAEFKQFALKHKEVFRR